MQNRPAVTWEALLLIKILLEVSGIVSPACFKGGDSLPCLNVPKAFPTQFSGSSCAGLAGG